jgi:hypothetical protein
MSAEQRAKLSLAQRAYVTHDPRWPEHRRKLAAAQEAKRMTLFDNEVAAIVALRRKGRAASKAGNIEIGLAQRVAPLSHGCLARPVRPRVRLDPHPDAGAAINALARLAHAKRRRGYRDQPL